MSQNTEDMKTQSKFVNMYDIMYFYDISQHL